MENKVKFEDIIDPWKEVSKDQRVLIGAVGVDCGSLEIGDPIRGCSPIICHTYTGDGCYPVFAQVIDGKRCLVIDLEAQVNGLEIFNEYPSRCPNCFELIDPHPDLASAEDLFEYTCECCGNDFIVNGRRITDFKDMRR